MIKRIGVSIRISNFICLLCLIRLSNNDIRIERHLNESSIVEVLESALVTKNLSAVDKVSHRIVFVKPKWRWHCCAKSWASMCWYHLKDHVIECYYAATAYLWHNDRRQLNTTMETYARVLRSHLTMCILHVLVMGRACVCASASDCVWYSMHAYGCICFRICCERYRNGPALKRGKAFADEKFVCATRKMAFDWFGSVVFTTAATSTVTV